MVCSSSGSARAISGRGTGLNPRPESMPSAGVNHDGRLSTGTGPKWRGATRASCRCAAAGEVEGCTTWEKCRRATEEAVGRATQAKCRACAGGRSERE